MQVSDAGALMRATLHASNILIKHRGMSPMLRGFNEMDVRKWLERREALEDLDEEVFEQVANVFVAEMVDHKHKNVMLGRVAAERQRQELRIKKREERQQQAGRPARRRARAEIEEANDDDDESSAHEQPHSGSEQALAEENGIHMDGKVFSIKRLVSDYHEFLPHLYPLVFSCTTPAAQRPHALLDYNLAFIVHTGRDVKTCKATLKAVIEQVVRLRIEKAATLRYDVANVHKMPCRIMLVLWGSSFHPATGKSYNAMRSELGRMNEKQCAPDGTNITMEMFSVTELQYDVTTHEDAAKYEVVNDPRSVPELRTIKEHQFSYIRQYDAQAMVLDLRIGQVVRELRTDFELGGRTHDYRIVVPQNYVLEKMASDNNDEGQADE